MASAKNKTNRCPWCNTDPVEAASQHEGPHATWCPHYRRPERPSPPSAKNEKPIHVRCGGEVIPDSDFIGDWWWSFRCVLCRETFRSLDEALNDE